MVLKLFKKVHFLQFCADFSKKYKSIKAIYIYTSERSCYTLSENGFVYCAMTGFELAVCNSQFAKRFGSLEMSFCIFSKNWESLKSDTS